ncbi:uncharacterized protein A4U43_C08F6150 [Asparagus officinalis]|nr:uncharacterized protein A4U43_C08F6150 [Asparagus officinalis]
MAVMLMLSSGYQDMQKQFRQKQNCKGLPCLLCSEGFQLYAKFFLGYILFYWELRQEFFGLASMEIYTNQYLLSQYRAESTRSGKDKIVRKGIKNVSCLGLMVSAVACCCG